MFYSGLTVFFYSVLDYLPQFQLLTPAMKLVLGFATPLLLLWAFFLLLYMGIPNTRVQFRHVWFPALLASLCIIGLQTVYVHVQVIVTSYSIIYGSLAALPLFMIWLQASWFIGIGFAEFGHANQNLSLGLDAEGVTYSVADQREHCLILLNLISRRQKDEARPSYARPAARETGYAYSHIVHCLRRLEETPYHLCRHQGRDAAFTPSRDTASPPWAVCCSCSPPIRAGHDHPPRRMGDEVRGGWPRRWPQSRRTDKISVNDCSPGKTHGKGQGVRPCPVDDIMPRAARVPATA